VSDPTDALIPVVDLAGWRHGDRKIRHQISAEVDDALQRSGFMLVTNHGVRTEAISAARAAALQFFRSDPATKEAVRIPAGAHNGWTGLGDEMHGATYGIDAGPDLKESFAITPPSFPARLQGAASGWYTAKWMRSPPNS
jgi:isopenicillin N synthase-like dioxygenase